jgi:CRP/FNR family transcriptional regulator, cyclic AMP receptor protein
MPLFQGLDQDGVAGLQAIAEPFAVDAGATLFRQGEAAEGLYLVADGRFALTSRAPGDEASTLVTVEPGAFLGELALLDGGIRSATATAETDGAGWLIPAERFDHLLRDARPAAVEAMQRIRTEVARRLRGTIAAIAALAAEARVAGVRGGGVAGELAPAGADAAALLGSLASFAPLGGRRCAALAGLGGCVLAPRGTLIAAAGTPATHLHIVLRGALRTAIPRDGAVEQLLVHAPGDLVGLLALLDGGPLASELMAREEALLLRIDRKTFLGLRNQDPDLAHKLYLIANRQLVRDLRRLTRHLGRARGLMAFNAQGGAG